MMRKMWTVVVSDSGAVWYRAGCGCGLVLFSVSIINVPSHTADYVNPELITTRTVTPHQHDTETNEGAPALTSESKKDQLLVG